MGMDSNNKKRGIIGILVITIVFAVLAIASASKMFNNIDEQEKLQKTSYMLLLEEELGIDFVTEDDFINFQLVNYEMVIVPQTHKYYIKPCFDFVVLSDGVVITNRNAKEFDDTGWKINDKIVKINDETLKGKSYFEIVDLMLSKTETTKKYTLSNGTEIEYKYQKATKAYEYNEAENILSIYNLDNVTTRKIHETVKEHPDLTLDLSKATVNTYEGLANFISLFSSEETPVFGNVTNEYGQKNRKIENLNIVVGNNQDKGILFALTSIKRLNSNILIDKTNLNTTQFYAVKTLLDSNCEIVIKNILLIAVSTINNNGGLYT